VGAAFVHGSVRLEVVLNVHLVFFKHEVGLLFRSIGGYNLVEVTSDSVLLVVEAFEVNSSNGVDVIGHQLAEHTSMIIINNLLVLTYKDELLFVHG
jgi:hypothetical protein